MELLAPWSLAALIAVPALFLWGLFGPRGRPVVVGSLILWRRALAGGPTGQPSARARIRDPVLWLDAAIVTMLVIACARPAVHTRRPTEPVASLVIDRSAGMAMQEPGQAAPRWVRLREMVRAALSPLGNVPLRLVFVPGPSGSTVAAEAPAGEASSLDAYWEPVLAAADVWSVAAGESAARPQTPVVVAAGVAPSADVPKNVYVLAPGGTSVNVGLARVAPRVEGGDLWLLVSVRAAATTGQPMTLQARWSGPDGAEAGSMRFQVRPGQDEVVRLPAGRAWQLTVAIQSPADGFPADDAAYLTAEPAEPIRVLLAGSPVPALRRALEAAGALPVEATRGAASAADSADLVVAVAAPLPDGWHGPAAVILPPGGVGPIRPSPGTGRAEWRVNPAHPLADALYLDAPRLADVPRYFLDGGTDVLVGSPDAPLIVTWRTGVQPGRMPNAGNTDYGRLAILFGLDEATTDWTLRAGFPVFWSRALDWLVPRAMRPSHLVTYRPLEPVGKGATAPAACGHHRVGEGRLAGVSFVGTGEGFEAGPGRDDSMAAVEAIRRSAETLRRAAAKDLWPYAAAAAIVLTAARARAAR